MNETSRCGERRALNARERSGDATSGDERRRGEARAKPVERGKSEAQVRDFSLLLGKRHPSTKDQVLEKGRSRAAGLPTYQFLRSSTSARAARARLRTKLDRPTDRCPPPTQLSHEMQSPEPTELEIA